MEGRVAASGGQGWVDRLRGGSRLRARWLVWLVFMATVGSFAGAQPTSAAGGTTITVNTGSDAAPVAGECSGNPGDCSLRQALDVANQTSGDTIVLPSTIGVFTLNDSNGPLEVDTSGTITVMGDGTSSPDVLIEPADTSFVGALFDVDSTDGSLVFNDVTLEGLGTSGSYSGLEVDSGGVTLDGVTVESMPEDGVLVEDGTLDLTNSTVANNGSGIENDDGAVSLSSVTLRDNGNTKGSLYQGNEGSLTTIEDTIIAGEPACTTTTSSFPVDNGGNLEDTEDSNSGPSCHLSANSSQVGSADLQGLADNGGPTETELLGDGSAAIGLGISCPTYDQRGVSRGSRCDSGAVAATPTITSVSVTSFDDASAELSANIEPLESEANYVVEYGTTDDYGSETSSQGVQGTSGTVTVQPMLTGLLPSTSYHYRVDATNDSGTTLGTDGTFETGPQLTGTPGTALSGTVVNQMPGCPTSATIDWGDNTATSAGTIQCQGNDFTVSGTHTYAAAGDYEIETTTTYFTNGGAEYGAGAVISAPAPPPTSTPATTTAPTTTTTPTTSTTAAPPPLPPPVSGQSFDVTPFLGTVLVNGVPLVVGEQIPVGAIVDTRNGTVVLESVAPDGTLQSAQFAGAIFQLEQTAGGITVLVLTGGNFGVCTAHSSKGVREGAKAPPKKSTTVVRSLWGNGHGQFETKGRYAAATVRGTIWHTSDRCDGTNVTVKRGTVTVLDLVRHVTVTVTAPNSYLAKAP